MKHLRFSVHGKFLLPEESKEAAIEFLVKQNVIAFIEVKPLYETNNSINVKIQRGQYDFSYHHSDAIGSLMIRLEKSTDPNYIYLTFDRQRTNCEAVEMTIILVQQSKFEEDFMSCDSLREKFTK